MRPRIKGVKCNIPHRVPKQTQKREKEKKHTHTFWWWRNWNGISRNVAFYLDLEAWIVVSGLRKSGHQKEDSGFR